MEMGCAYNFKGGRLHSNYYLASIIHTGRN